MNKNFIVLFLYIMCILLNIFDIFSTYIILQNAGEESNFIMKYSIELFGSFWGLIYPKIITLFLISLLVYFYFKKITTERENLLLILSLLFINVIYLIVMTSKNLKYLLFIITNN